MINSWIVTVILIKKPFLIPNQNNNSINNPDKTVPAKKVYIAL